MSDHNSSSNDAAFSVLPGGIPSLQFGANQAPADAALASAPSAYVVGGAVHTFDFEAGTGTSAGGYASLMVGEGAADHSSGFKNATRFGSPWEGPLDRDTLVSVGGMQARIGDLERMGLAVRTDDERGYRPAGALAQAPQRAPAQPAQAQAAAARSAFALDSTQQAGPLPEHARHYFTPNELKTIGDLGTKWSEAAITQAAAEYLVHGAVDWSAAGHLLGVDENTAKAQAGPVLQAYADAGRRALAAVGAEADAVMEWARTHRAGGLREALVMLTSAQDAGPLRALAEDYFRSVPPSVEDLEDGQRRGLLTYRTVQGGAVLVTLPGRPETDVGTAARLGWL